MDWREYYRERGYIPVKTIAYLTGYHPQTIRRWIKEGKLNALHVNKYSEYRVTFESFESFEKKHLNK